MKLGDDFLGAHGARIRDAYSEHFKLLARSLASDFENREGRKMDDAEQNEMIRWVATEALTIGAFAYGGANGSVEAAGDLVREEFLRGARWNGRKATGLLDPSDAVEQEPLGGWTRTK